MRPTRSFAANITWAKWDKDEDLDLIIGNIRGGLFVWKGRDHQTFDFGAGGANTFSRIKLNIGEDPNQILIDGGKVLPGSDRHSAPVAADWDGDGLFDILVGSFTGRVFLLRNTGKPGEPKFDTREVILDGGRGVQWLFEEQVPEIGTRSQLHVADYNGDGKLDLLVGYHSQSWIQRKDLTRQDKKRLAALREQLAVLNSQVNNDYYETSDKFLVWYLPQNDGLRKRHDELSKEAATFLKQKESQYESGGEMRTIKYNPVHGLVWVYLRN